MHIFPESPILPAVVVGFKWTNKQMGNEIKTAVQPERFCKLLTPESSDSRCSAKKNFVPLSVLVHSQALNYKQQYKDPPEYFFYNSSCSILPLCTCTFCTRVKAKHVVDPAGILPHCIRQPIQTGQQFRFHPILKQQHVPSSWLIVCSILLLVICRDWNVRLMCMFPWIVVPQHFWSDIPLWNGQMQGFAGITTYCHGHCVSLLYVEFVFLI